jgi:hypothetical protein
LSNPNLRASAVLLWCLALLKQPFSAQLEIRGTDCDSTAAAVASQGVRHRFLPRRGSDTGSCLAGTSPPVVPGLLHLPCPTPYPRYLDTSPDSPPHPSPTQPPYESSSRAAGPPSASVAPPGAAAAVSPPSMRDLGPGAFTRELDDAVAGGGADLAVHSLKVTRKVARRWRALDTRGVLGAWPSSLWQCQCVT